MFFSWASFMNLKFKTMPFIKTSIKLLVTCFLHSSCKVMLLNHALKKYGIYETQAEVKMIEGADKHIAFIPMHHIGKREFYNSIKQVSDSLQNKGYSIFYETIIIPEYLSKQEEITYRKKIRKIMRTDATTYLDTINNLFMGKHKLPRGVELVNQPANDKLYDVAYAKNIDVYLDSLVIKFENRYGEVVLSECDLNSPYPSENHNCEYLSRDLSKAFMEEFAQDYRNRHIAEKVMKTKNNKIAIFYGSAHYSGLMELLSTNEE